MALSPRTMFNILLISFDSPHLCLTLYKSVCSLLLCSGRMKDLPLGEWRKGEWRKGEWRKGEWRKGEWRGAILRIAITVKTWNIRK